MTRVGVFALFLVACGGDGFQGVLREPPPPPDSLTGSSSGTSSSTSADLESSTGDASVGVADACAADEPCPDGTFCVAPNAGGNIVGVGAYACTATCVEPDDPTRWCLDAASCCDADATCELGFCRVATTSESTDSSGSSESSTGVGTDTSTTG